MHKVSVVIPTYNCSARLVGALQSVAAQRYALQHVEVLVIDDGSSDDTAERVATFTTQSPLCVRYVRQANAGPAAARNHGLRLARGDAIAFLDADDAWHPEKLHKQLPLLDGRVGLVYSGVAFVDAQGHALRDYVRRIAMHRGDILLALFCDFFLLTSAVVLSRAAVDACGEFNEKLAVGEDYEYFLRVASRFEADCVDEELLVRSVRPDSLSRRDYALDARVDLATLSAFVRANPQFARAHRAAVKRRIARYRYDFAWRLLADNRRGEAALELLRSLREHASVAAARTLARTLLPLPVSG
jgi:glycosyltransferase involved in cell wall biosynthesis